MSTLTRHQLALIPVFTALTAAGAFIKIPVAPVPITMQNLFVVMSGMMLGPKIGAMSQMIYIMIGLMGLPVFSGGGGPGYVMSPTLGYLVGFIAASAVSGYLIKDKPLSVRNVLFASAAGMLTIYLIGMPYLACYLKFVVKKPDALWIAVKTGMALFLPGDALKCALLAMVMPRIGYLRENMPYDRK